MNLVTRSRLSLDKKLIYSIAELPTVYTCVYKWSGSIERLFKASFPTTYIAYFPCKTTSEPTCCSITLQASTLYINLCLPSIINGDSLGETCCHYNIIFLLFLFSWLALILDNN